MTSQSKSKLLKEIHEYNKELSKHLPKVDFEKVTELRGALERRDDEDFYSLLTSNFVELRTEVALLRKNLSNDIEAMVLKQVTELQSKFFKQLTDFSSKIVFDIKENLGNYVQELNNNVLDIKREFNKLSTKNELIENRFDELRDSSLDFKAYIDKLEYAQNSAFKNLTDEIEKIHRQNSVSFTKVVDRLNSEIRTSREAFRQLGLEIGKSQTLIKKEIEGLDSIKSKTQKSSKDHEEPEETFETMKFNKEEILNEFKKNDLLPDYEEEPIEDSNKNNGKNKFLEIEEKIRNLNNLR